MYSINVVNNNSAKMAENRLSRRPFLAGLQHSGAGVDPDLG